ncbi:anion exchange protein 3-like [Sycon ciliatum]|uniref:anion exchange protein 3-like n=1 Tax=Sycon ciliatum TaxID=27933 RepID=UPI0020AE8706|eukprot:scpid21213/ scgid21927/ Anion exchange protein 2; Band 3-related protein; Solute carrier family 4 member 2
MGDQHRRQHNRRSGEHQHHDGNGVGNNGVGNNGIPLINVEQHSPPPEHQQQHHSHRRQHQPEQQSGHQTRTPAPQNNGHSKGGGGGGGGGGAPNPGRQQAEVQLSSVPQEGFVQMSQLHMEDDQAEWRQRGRWLKFEEEVNEDVGRWRKPQASSLSFHSLLELRRCIDKGTVLLDLPKPDLMGIATAVVDDMVMTGQLERAQRTDVLHALLQRHVHQSDLAKLHQPLSRMGSVFRRKNRLTPSVSIQSLTSAPLSRTGSNRFSVRSVKNKLTPRHKQLQRSHTEQAQAIRAGSDGSSAPKGVPKSNLLGPPGQLKAAGGVTVNAGADVPPCDCGDPECTVGLEPNLGEEDKQLTKDEQDLLKKIPIGAEATTVLVGTADFLTSPVMAFVRLNEGRPLGNLTEVPIPVRFLFVLLGPEEEGNNYQEIGRAIATLMADPVFHEAAYRAESRQDLLTSIEEFLEDSLVLPRGKYDKDLLLPAIKQQNMRRRKNKAERDAMLEKEPEEDPLAKTGHLFGGLWQDLGRLKRRYVSDFTDAMNMQSFVTFVFMYFGSIAPIIAFGSLLGEKTKHTFGLPETIISSALGGIIWGIFAGQPMMIIGPTGPTIVFEGVIYIFAKENNINFFPWRFWIGVWVFVILALVTVTDSSYLVKKFTRFTEEVFAALIAFIFIFEPLISIDHAFKHHPVDINYCTTDYCITPNASAYEDDLNGTEPTAAYNCTGAAYGNASNASSYGCNPGAADKYGGKPGIHNQPNSAMLYMVLLIGTFVMAYALRKLKTSRYLGKIPRRILGDFGIAFSILTFVFLDHFLFKTIHSDKIDAPSGIVTSTPRSWLISPMDGMTAGHIFGAFVPGLLVAFLVFVETQVTCLICCSPDHKFKKIGGYHWNLAVVAIYSLFCSYTGLPWMCGTPVPSLSHTQSLLKINKNVAPGEKPKIEGAYEQRLTNILIHGVIACSLAPPVALVLRQIPIAVIMGVFLYLGFCNILTLQFTQRCILMLVPAKHHPEDAAYVRHVGTIRMHLYTVVQIFCFGVLVVFKMTKAGLVFPLMVGLMVPLRDYVIGYFYSDKELHALDPHGPVESDDEGEVDEYETHMPA